MAWRGVVAIAFVCVVMAIVVPLTYSVGDALTVSKGDAQRRAKESEEGCDESDGKKYAVEHNVAHVADVHLHKADHVFRGSGLC